MRFEGVGLSKSFGGTRALSSVPLTLESGRVHALVGENGAGKSTLMKIAGGVFKPDAGSMRLNDAPYAPSSARAARRQGVALIYQELTIAMRLSVAENIFIDRLRDFARFGLVSRRALEDQAGRVLDKLGLDIDPGKPAESLDLGQMKCVEICRALAVEPDAILLDESTAFMSHAEVDAVMAAIGHLREEGLAVAFVSHHLDEVFQVADDITVLKDGGFVGRYGRDDVDEHSLPALMVGRDMASGLYPPPRPAPDHNVPPIVSLCGVRTSRAAAPCDVELRPGEVLGFAGLKRAGGDQIIAALAGDERLSGGKIHFRGEVITTRSPRHAWASGFAYLSGDRTGEGLITAFTVTENLAMAAMPRRGPMFDNASAAALAQKAIADLHIKTSGADAPVDSLSGGNMQKVLLGKCLATEPAVLLLNNPTRGVDMGARQEIYRALRAMTDAGGAIILLSEDLPELIGLADRIVAFRRGSISRTFAHTDGVTESDIVAEII